MIAHLRGKVVSKQASTVVIECGGVGYGVAMSLTALAKVRVGEDVGVHVYTHVGQDILRLYGFLDALEQRVFAVLIAISGVGPKLAMAVLSTLAPGELAAVVAGGRAADLVRIPGVGQKTAARLLLELRDRLPKVVAAAHPEQAAGVAADDLASALVDLGFSAAAAQRAAQHALRTLPNEQDVSTLVREALRASTRAD